MTESEKILKLEQDIADITKVLISEEDFQLPQNLRSEKLLHLLPDSQDKKTINILEIFFSKKTIPIITTAVAAVLIIAILPKISFNQNYLANSKNSDISEEKMAYMETENNEATTQYAADAGVSDALGIDSKGEDLTQYYEEEKTPTGTDSDNAGIIEENMKDVKEEGSATSVSDTETTQESFIANPKREYTPVPTVESESPVDQIGEANQIPINWNNYSVYWSANDPNSSENENYSVFLYVIDNNQNIYIQKGLEKLNSISNMVVNNNTVYILGDSNDGLSMVSYTGVSNGQLNYKKDYQISGKFISSFEKENCFYIFTENTNSSSSNKLLIEDSVETSSVTVSVLDIGSGNIKATTIMGSGLNFTVTDISFNFSYKNKSDELKTAEVIFNKQDLSLK